MKTIGAISDIHGNIAALEAVAADLQKRGVDTVLNLGDHLSGPLWPKETIQFLMQQQWVQISGNHDRQIVHQDPRSHGLSDRFAFKVLSETEKDWLRALPSSIQLDEHVFIFHGTPASDSEYLLETVEHEGARLASHFEVKQRLGTAKSPVMLCGHSHIQRIVQVDQNVVIVNPGSVGLPAYKDDSPQHHVMESGSPHARYSILQHHDTWTIELISIPYDYQRASERARKNNRPDWAHALQTGYVTQ